MNLWIVLGLVALVAVVAMVLRGSSASPSLAPPRDPDELEDESEPAEEKEEELAITSDGAVFIPDGYAVRVIPTTPLEVPSEDVEAGLMAMSASERAALMRSKPGSPLSAGDFTAARIRRGAAGVVPWLLETLGRDGEYIPFPFETEDGARAALALLEARRIVRRPRDEDDRPIPASPEDFEEGRRRYDETWRALALERERGEDTGPPYSDRR